MHIGIDIHDGIISNLLQGIAFLHAELAEGGAVVGGCILREVAGIGSEVAAQNVGNLEAHEEIGVNIQVGDGQHVGFRGLLIGEHRLPVERPEGELLRQRGCEQADGVGTLPDGDGVTNTIHVFSNGVVLSEIGVVLDFVDGNTQRGARLLIAEESFDAAMDDFVQTVVVPPEMLRVVVAVVEGGVQAIEEAASCESDGVAEQSEVQVGGSIDLQLAGIFADEPRLGFRTIVECLSLCLDELSADAQRVFLVAHGCSQRVG